MIYFLFGPDTYRSRRKLAGIVEAFREKAGGVLNVTRIDAEDQPETVFAVGRTASLFAEKELFVVERASTASGAAAEYLRSRLLAWRADRALTVIFWEEEVDTAEGTAKDLKRQATKTQEFKLLGPAAASRWLEEEVARRRLRLAPEERQLLLARHGPDLWALANDLDKAGAGWSPEAARRDEERVWNFTDAFLAHRRRAFLPLARLLARGEEPVALLGALAASLRALAVVWWGMEHGKLAEARRGVHPYVVKKNMELARSVDGEILRSRFAELIRADTELKTGALPPPLPLIRLVLTPSPKES